MIDIQIPFCYNPLNMNSNTKPVVAPQKHELKSYRCPGCKDSFSKPIQMIGHAWNRHRLKVTKEGKIRCPFDSNCSFETDNVHGLRGHKRKHPGATIETKAVQSIDPLACKHEGCGFVAKNRFSLSAHARSHKGEIQSDKTEQRISALLRELKELGVEVQGDVSSTEPIESAVPLMINCCPKCGHDIRAANNGELVARMKMEGR
jgi:hypothetical protein